MFFAKVHIDVNVQDPKTWMQIWVKNLNLGYLPILNQTFRPKLWCWNGSLCFLYLGTRPNNYFRNQNLTWAPTHWIGLLSAHQYLFTLITNKTKQSTHVHHQCHHYHIIDPLHNTQRLFDKQQLSFTLLGSSSFLSQDENSQEALRVTYVTHAKSGIYISASLVSAVLHVGRGHCWMYGKVRVQWLK